MKYWYVKKKENTSRYSFTFFSNKETKNKVKINISIGILYLKNHFYLSFFIRFFTNCITTYFYSF